MNSDTVINLAVGAMELVLKIGGPLMIAGLVVGLMVSILQAVTQVQEQSLVFIPKLVVVGILLIVLGPWMLDEIRSYATEIWTSIPTVAAK